MIAREHRIGAGRVRAVDVGEGPPLVLIHGLGGSLHNWSANIAALAQRHRVIALDLPGFGGSDAYSGVVTIERFVDTIIALLDRLAVGPATFIGNSLGGLLTIETAVRHPDRVRGAVLVASGGIPLTALRYRLAIPLARALNVLLRRRIGRRLLERSRWARHLIARAIVHDPSAIPEQRLAEALAGFGGPGFNAALAAGMSYDAHRRAPRVASPTLVVWGSEDRLLPPAMGEEIQRLIPGSRLEVWDAIGHCPMLEDPRRFEVMIATFVGETSDDVPAKVGLVGTR